MEYPPTPVLTEHARERCAEMGIRTRVAKQIWRDHTLTYPLHDQDRIVVISADHPRYALVVDEHGDRPVVVTVLFNHPDRYVREGETFRVKRKS
jgi:hypothetical protein